MVQALDTHVASDSGRGRYTELSLSILGQHIRMSCDEAALMQVLARNFAALRVDHRACAPDLSYVVARKKGAGMAIRRNGRPLATASTPGDALFYIEKDITVELQLRRPDLLFVHAAAIEAHGRAYLLAGESGAGKSTTTWAMLHHGVHYLSDELSPVVPASLEVWAYPHALCLKRRPPSPYPLPACAMDLGATLHIPADVLPLPAGRKPCTLAAIFFVSHRIEQAVPVLLTPGHAAAQLYLLALNLLAHPTAGLDAVAAIAQKIPAFSVGTAHLPEACEQLYRIIDR